MARQRDTIALQDMPPLAGDHAGGCVLPSGLDGSADHGGTSTTVQVDAGVAPASGYGIEVRENDYGWGQANDRNLLGRFSTQAFSLARLAATQDYFLRLYDNSSPPKYSRYRRHCMWTIRCKDLAMKGYEYGSQR